MRRRAQDVIAQPDDWRLDGPLIWTNLSTHHRITDQAVDAVRRSASPRRLPSIWEIQVCPGCNGLLGELTRTHLGDCEYRGTMFVPRTVTVVPEGG